MDQFFCIGGASPVILGLFYVTTLDDAGNSSPYTFTDAPVGIAAARRFVFVEVATQGTGTPTPSAVTIGGISAVRITQALQTTRNASIWMALVPTGTTATIIVTVAGSPTSCVISIYRSPTDVAFVDVVTGIGAGVTLSDVAVVPSGFVIAMGVSGGTTDIGESWSGIDALVVDDERTIEGTKVSSCSIQTTEAVSTNDLAFTNVTAAAAASFLATEVAAYTPALSDTFSDATDLTTYTFTAQSLGTPHANRQLLIGFAWSGNNRTVVSVTVDGNSATEIATSTGNLVGTSLFKCPLPSGATGDVVIVMSAACTHMVGGIIDTRPRVSTTPVDSGSASLTTTSLTVSNIETRLGGFMVAVGLASNTETQSAVYNGVDVLLKLGQDSVESALTLVFCACLTDETATTNDPGFSSASSVARRAIAASFV